MAIKPTKAQTVAQYIAQIDQPRKSDIATLHALITKAAPKLKPRITYGMIGYGSYHYKYASGREGDSPVIALASQKSYISVYVCGAEGGQPIAEKHKHEFPKANVGKGCIRFKRVADIDLKVLERIIKLGAKNPTAAAASA
jgi:uncharacterized protein YdhG (YjbR/CyaY superfamily)